MNTQKRLTILTTDEINQLYSRPLFATKERVQYFSLPQMENELLYTLESDSSHHSAKKGPEQISYVPS
ncbi:hypothetical protein C5137_28985 [Bacillus cereus]|nr:hypothetical protein [Bacillus cereus]